MSSAREPGLKAWLKHLAMRVLRPGVAPVQEQVAGVQAEVRGLRDRLDEIDTDREKYDSELEYWRWLVKKGGSERAHGAPFERVFAKWTRDRLVKMGGFLGLPEVGRAGDIDDWASERSVVEIGAGPYPLVAAAAKGWKRCVAVDPIARGYVEEGLVAGAAGRVVYIESPGERVPLPSGNADLVVIENCLDHVREPAAVLREVRRLLAPGGLMWIFVDLSNHVDHMHPHAMNEQKVRGLLRDAGFAQVRDEVTSHKAHPEAYGSYCGLLRREEVARRGSGCGGLDNDADVEAANGAVRVAVVTKAELSLNGSAAGRPQK